MTKQRPGTAADAVPTNQLPVAELLRDVTGLERLHGLQLSLLEGLRRKLEAMEQSGRRRSAPRRRLPRRRSKP